MDDAYVQAPEHRPVAPAAEATGVPVIDLSPLAATPPLLAPSRPVTCAASMPENARTEPHNSAPLSPPAAQRPGRTRALHPRAP